MSITAAEANAQLSNIKSVEQLRELISQLDVSATGTTTMLYSGGKSTKIVETLMAQGEDIRAINGTEASRFLNDNPLLESKLIDLFEAKPDGVTH